MSSFCVFASSAAPFERDEMMMMMMLMLKNLLLFHHSLFTLFSLSDDDDETMTGNESSTRSSPYLRKRSSARYIREEDSLEPRTRIKFNTRNITTPFLLHSDSLKVDVLADKFFHVRDKHSDLRQRAVSLKETCKELGTQHKFSFIVLDCVARRVFARRRNTRRL